MVPPRLGFCPLLECCEPDNVDDILLDVYVNFPFEKIDDDLSDFVIIELSSLSLFSFCLSCLSSLFEDFLLKLKNLPDSFELICVFEFEDFLQYMACDGVKLYKILSLISLQQKKIKLKKMT